MVRNQPMERGQWGERWRGRAAPAPPHNIGAGRPASRGSSRLKVERASQFGTITRRIDVDAITQQRPLAIRGRFELPDAVVGLEVTADLAKRDALVGDEVGAEYVRSRGAYQPKSISCSTSSQLISGACSRTRHRRRCGTYFGWRPRSGSSIWNTTAGGASMSMAARTVPRRAPGSRLARITISPFSTRCGLGRGQLEIGRPRLEGAGQPEAENRSHPLRCAIHG